MEIIPRKARRITYSTEIRNLKKRLSLSDYQRAVLIGNILGDGNLEVNWSKTNYKFRVGHMMKHKDYVMWKYDIFKDWILTEPKFQKWNNAFYFRTISHKEFTDLRKLFYKDRQKIIPENIEDLLKNPITLAVWFMDDGNARIEKGIWRGYHINSQSFSFDENCKLANVILKNFGVFCRIHKNHNKYRLYIGGKENSNKFKNVIGKFVIPILKYKLG